MVATLYRLQKPVVRGIGVVGTLQRYSVTKPTFTVISGISLKLLPIASYLFKGKIVGVISTALNKVITKINTVLNIVANVADALLPGGRFNGVGGLFDALGQIITDLALGLTQVSCCGGLWSGSASDCTGQPRPRRTGNFSFDMKNLACWQHDNEISMSGKPFYGIWNPQMFIIHGKFVIKFFVAWLLGLIPGL